MGRKAPVQSISLFFPPFSLSTVQYHQVSRKYAYFNNSRFTHSPVTFYTSERIIMLSLLSCTVGFHCFAFPAPLALNILEVLGTIAESSCMIK